MTTLPVPNDPFGSPDYGSSSEVVAPTGPALNPQDIFSQQDFGTQILDETGAQQRGAWSVDMGRHTANDLVRQLWRMSPAEVEQLQLALYQGGYYSDDLYRQHRPPSWGVVDETTQEAYYYLLLEAGRKPDRQISQLLDDGATRNQSRLAALQTSGQVADTGPEVVQLPNYTLTDPASLRTMYRAVGQSLLGRDLTDDEQQRFAGAIRDEERAQGLQRQAESRATADARTAARQADVDKTAKGPKPTPDEVSAFTRSLVDTVVGPASAFGVLQNTGLNRYGLDPDTLREWASEARAQGVAVPALSSPQALDLVVQWKVGDLYSQFGGDWESVATTVLGDIDSAIAKARQGKAWAGALPSGAGVASTPSATPMGHGAGTQNMRTIGSLRPGDFTMTDSIPGAAPTPRPLGQGHGAGSTQAPATGLSTLAQQLVGTMGQALGRAPGAQPSGTQVQAPVFTGGAAVENIDAQARAQERIRQEHPEDVFEYSMMRTLNAFEQILGGGA